MIEIEGELKGPVRIVVVLDNPTFERVLRVKEYIELALLGDVARCSAPRVPAMPEKTNGAEHRSTKQRFQSSGLRDVVTTFLSTCPNNTACVAEIIAHCAESFDADEKKIRASVYPLLSKGKGFVKMGGGQWKYSIDPMCTCGKPLPFADALRCHDCARELIWKAQEKAGAK